MMPRRIIQHPYVGQNNRIGFGFRRVVDGLVPWLFVSGAGKCIDGDKDFAPSFVGVNNAFDHFVLIKIQSRIISRVRPIPIAAINSVRARINGGA
jgi:hypothetical protein